MGRKAMWLFKRVIVSTTIQAAGAPFVDQCSGIDAEGNNFRGIAILLQPWRRNRWLESNPQIALVLGRKVGKKSR